jgi:hypothetical protein
VEGDPANHVSLKGTRHSHERDRNATPGGSEVALERNVQRPQHQPAGDQEHG